MPAKPKILMIGALPPPAIGPSIAMERLLKSAELNEAFSVSFLDISDRRSPDNIGQFDWLNIALGIKHACTCLIRLLFQRPAVVYLGISQGLWGYLRDLAFIVPALCLRRRVVIHLRGSEFRRFYETMPAALRWITRLVFRRVARVIVLGQSLTKVFDGLVEPGRIAVIPNGIRYQDYEMTSAWGNGIGMGKRILFLSSLRRRKGVFLLLEALPEVFCRHPDARATFAGRWRSSEEEREAMALIARLGIDKRCRFLGEVTGEEKLRLYKTHDVFVFPPVEPEGLPWVILEAMSAGLPVVTTDQGAISELVQDGTTGFVVPPTPDGVSEKICFLLDNPHVARAMGLSGRRRIAEHFSEKAYLRKLVSLFAELLHDSAECTSTGCCSMRRCPGLNPDRPASSGFRVQR